MSDADKLVISAAITGIVPKKAQTPYVPISVDEIVSCVCRVRDAGASIVHVHARDSQEDPVSNAGAYIELVTGIREACPDILISVSLSGRRETNIHRRAAALESKPDMASLTLGSMNFQKETSVNSPEAIVYLAKRIREANAVPELEVFEPGFINYALYLTHKGILGPPFYFNLLLGSLGTSPLDPILLGHMVKTLPSQSVWAVGGIGRCQLDANVMGIAAGGHVRVGLEDNIHFDRQRLQLADNAHFVERIVRIGREMGRDPASPEETRNILGMP